MKKSPSLCALLLAVVFSALVFGQGITTTRRPQAITVEEQIRRLEEVWVKARKDKNPAPLRRVIAKGWFNTNEKGKIENRDDLFSSIRSDPDMIQSEELSDVKVRVNGNTAVFTGRTREKGTRKGTPYEKSQRRTDVFMKRAGRWQAVVSQVIVFTQMTFIVNDTGDTDDANWMDGICADAKGKCTLRAAIEQANANTGNDVIKFDMSPGSAFDPATAPHVIQLGGALPVITDDVTIIGPGATQLTVSGNGNRVFNVMTASLVYIYGLTISNGVVGAGGSGGGIWNQSTGLVNVHNCILSNNAAFYGGAIANTGGGSIAVSFSTLSNNGASSYGGALYTTTGVNNVYSCTLSNNTTRPSGGNGGAIFIGTQNSLNVTNSTLSNNSASTYGGAIQNLGTLQVSNSTLSGNTVAASNGLGGGIFQDPSSGNTNIKSSIVAWNTAPTGPDVSGTYTSSGFNLIRIADGSIGFTNGVNNDQVGSNGSPLDPKLEMDPSNTNNPLLKDNGGPTQTVALLCGSPAIDQGTSHGLMGDLKTDQRSLARTFNDPSVTDADDGTDVGAFELQVAVPSTPIITAPRKVVAKCRGYRAAVLAVPGMNYTWSITGGAITSRGTNTPSIIWTAGNSGTVTLTVTETNTAGCSSSATHMALVIVPSAPNPNMPIDCFPP